MAKAASPQNKKELRAYQSKTAAVFHCRVCKATQVTLYKHPAKGYVCLQHRISHG